MWGDDWWEDEGLVKHLFRGYCAVVDWLNPWYVVAVGLLVAIVGISKRFCIRLIISSDISTPRS